jgi:hypothetical protein
VTTLPEWLVERAALDEVPAASRARLAGADPDQLAARIAAIRERDAAELRAHPPEPAVTAIERAAARARQRRVSRRRAFQGGLLAVAGAAVVLFLAVGRRSEGTLSTQEAAPREVSPVESTRVKGDLRLLAFRKAGDRALRLAPGAIVRAGDVLQLRFNGGGRRHGVIASIDGAGAVTLHFPDAEDAATDLPQKTTDLPHAYALDDAPRFERFFFITADEPIDVARSLDALRALAGRPDGDRAALALPPSFRQVSLLLHKAPPR